MSAGCPRPVAGASKMGHIVPMELDEVPDGAIYTGVAMYASVMQCIPGGAMCNSGAIYNNVYECKSPNHSHRQLPQLSVAFFLYLICSQLYVTQHIRLLSQIFSLILQYRTPRCVVSQRRINTGYWVVRYIRKAFIALYFLAIRNFATSRINCQE